MPALRRLLLSAAATALAVGGGVVALDRDPGTVDEPEATSAPLTSFDTSRVTILRTGFCDRVADTAVTEALQAEPEEESSYDNGDRVRLAAGTRDRAHEYGCSWTADGATAAAWVFAPPVTRGAARDLLRRARGERGCEPVPDAPAYGDPSVALVCTRPRGREVSFRGLFGDAWLVCSIRSPDVSADRTGRWCVAAARAASADERGR
jgi:hypothetical protein